MSAPTDPEKAFRRMIRDTFDDVVRPMADAWRAIDEAIDLEDDAALGRRVREIVAAYAGTQLEWALRRRANVIDLAARRPHGGPAPGA